LLGSDRFGGTGVSRIKTFLSGIHVFS